MLDYEEYLGIYELGDYSCGIKVEFHVIMSFRVFPIEMLIVLIGESFRCDISM